MLLKHFSLSFIKDSAFGTQTFSNDLFPNLIASNFLMFEIYERLKHFGLSIVAIKFFFGVAIWFLLNCQFGGQSIDEESLIFSLIYAGNSNLEDSKLGFKKNCLSLSSDIWLLGYPHVNIVISIEGLYESTVRQLSVKRHCLKLRKYPISAD